MFEVIIHNKTENKYYAPAVLDGAKIEWTISGAPGKFTFTVYKDETLKFVEGDTVQVKVGDKAVFFGFVFAKKRNKDSSIDVTAYDQLRYLKNKESWQYKNMTATQVIQKLAEYFQLKVGTLADTGFVIDKRVEDNATLFDIIQGALDITLVNTKEVYVLYDDFQKLMLSKPIDMAVPILIDNETAEDFDYESSIDKDTYNLVKLVVEDKQVAGEGKRKEFYAPMSPDEFAKSKEKDQWGVLQYYEKMQKNIQNPQERANQMLKFYNVVRRKLDIKGAAGDIRVRAGSMIYVKLNLGDVELAQKVLVTKVVHTFSNQVHLMDLTLKGGVINDQ